LIFLKIEAATVANSLPNIFDSLKNPPISGFVNHVHSQRVSLQT
jgi:hypothetical protein